MIHVSGVGLLGSFLLHELARLGLSATWDDANTRFAAWRASTGAIIPCEDQDVDLYALGYRMWRDNAVHRPELAQFAEKVETVYVMKNPPSRVTRKWVPVVRGENRIWREPLPGWQFDVDGFVNGTQQKFSAQRLPVPPANVLTIRSRGVMETVNTPTTVWGWRVPVSISPLPGCGVWSTGDCRPVIHFNDPERAFERFYFHPRAGHPNIWWAGSEAVLQKRPIIMAARAAVGFSRYQKTVTRRFADQLRVDVLGQVTEGWRAKPKNVHKKDYESGFCWEATKGVFIAKPLYKSGVQCGPLFAAAILAKVLKT